MTAVPEVIRTTVARLIAERLPHGINAVDVEPAISEDGNEYFLVTVELTRPDIDDDTLLGLVEELEEEIAGLDDRYPSVRFLDAA